MIRIRFLIIVLVIVITGIVLQTFNLVDFGRAFRLITQPSAAPAALVEPQSAGTIPDNPDRWLVLHAVGGEGLREGLREGPDEGLQEGTLLSHLQRIFDQSRIAVEFVDCTRPDALQALTREMNERSRIVALPGALDTLDPALLRLITESVAQGAELLAVAGTDNQDIRRVAGIVEVRARTTADAALPGAGKEADPFPVRGLKFIRPLFPLFETSAEAVPLVSDVSAGWAGGLRIDPVLNGTVELTAEYLDGIPLIWSAPSGRGQVHFVNGRLFELKVNRGLLLQLLLTIGDYGIAFIQADGLLTIRDFPAPLSSQRDEAIFADYQRDTVKFIKEIWWADIETLISRFGLRASGFASIRTDSGEVIGGGEALAGTDSGPEPSDVVRRENLFVFGSMLAGAGVEIGIQGFGPGLLTGTPPDTAGAVRDTGWSPDPDEVRRLLELQKAELESLFGPLPYRTFAPYSTEADAAALTMAQSIYPDLSILIGLHTPCAAESCEPDLPQVELQPNSAVPAFYQLPVFSSGYRLTPAGRWSLISGMAELGMFHHVISPLSLLAGGRESSEPWRILQLDFEEMLREIMNAYPFLEGRTALQSVSEVRAAAPFRMHTKGSGGTITIALQDIPLPQKFYFRSPTPVTGIRGGLVRPLGTPGLYLLEARRPEITISVRDDQSVTNP